MASNIDNNFDLGPDILSEVKEMKFGIVVSNWNKNITDNLFDGAYKTLVKYGVKEENIIKIEVPGSFELVYGCKIMSKNNVDAVIAIGCIIKGETDHYDYICSSVSSGITQLNIINDTPIVFCVLTLSISFVIKSIYFCTKPCANLVGSSNAPALMLLLT